MITTILQAGGLYSQNYKPTAVFSMSGIDSVADESGGEIQAVIDPVRGYQAHIHGNVTWDESESYIQPGSSLRFDNGSLTVAQNNDLDYETDYYANIRFRLSELLDGGILLRKGTDSRATGYELEVIEIDGSYRVQARVSTSAGNFFVYSATALVTDEWFLAGLQLKSGVLTLGVNQERISIGAPGQVINNEFGSHLLIGNGIKGWIDDVKLGQIDDSQGTLVLIDGEQEKQITFDSEGKAHVTISGGTGSVYGLGSKVGFSIIKETLTGAREEKELNYMSSLSGWLLDRWIPASYAQSLGDAREQEGGLAVVDGQAFAEAIDMLKRAGKPALDALTTAAKFLFEMTSLSDIWQLSKAVYLWMNGRFEDVDKIELAFAGIGLTLTVTTVAITIGSGGFGAPGSIAAMLSVKASLRVLKTTLKEVFQREPLELLKIGGTIVRWAFDLVGNILSGTEGRQAALQQLTDFKDVFIDMISSGTTVAWSLLKLVGTSTRGWIVFLKFRRLKNIQCGVAGVYEPDHSKYVRLTPIDILDLLPIQRAIATSFCGSELVLKAQDIIKVKGLNGVQAEELMTVATRLNRVDNGISKVIEVSGDTLDKMADMVVQGQGSNLYQFLDNIQNPNLEYMGEFTFENMGKQIPTTRPGVETVMDELIDAMGQLPTDDPRKYRNAFRQLSAPTQSNVRGVYGEASTFRRLKREPLTDDGTNIRANPDEFIIGQNVDGGKQGVDIESRLESGVLADESLIGETLGGRPMLVEVKTYTASYSPKAAGKQAGRHFESNITRLHVRENTDLDGPIYEWAVNGEPPHLHYEFSGEGFIDSSTGVVKEGRFTRIKNAILKACEDRINIPPLNEIIPPFSCKNDISFNIVEELIHPLTSNH